MIRHDMTYMAPATMSELLERVEAAAGSAAVVGGGTWLVPNMTHGLSRPKIVLDLRRLSLNSIWHEEGYVVVGARTTYDQLCESELVRERVPLLAHMAGQITGGRAITGLATLAGSACYANPSSDAPAVLVVLGAAFRLQSRSKTRDLMASDFFVGAFTTARRDDEVLTEIRVPFSPPGHYFGYKKLKFATGSSPIVTASFVAGPPGSSARLAIGAAGVRPVLWERIFDRPPLSEEALQIGHDATALIEEGWSDELAEASYRLAVAPAVVQSALLESFGRPLND